MKNKWKTRGHNNGRKVPWPAQSGIIQYQDGTWTRGETDEDSIRMEIFSVLSTRGPDGLIPTLVRSYKPSHP